MNQLALFRLMSVGLAGLTLSSVTRRFFRRKRSSFIMGRAALTLAILIHRIDRLMP